MTKEELKSKIEMQFSFGEMQMKNTGGLIPMFSVVFTLPDVSKKQEFNFVLAGGKIMENRDEFVYLLGGIFAYVNHFSLIKSVECVTMLSEAWTSFVSKENYDADNWVMPSKDLNRQEVLFCCGKTPENITYLKAKQIVRPIEDSKKFSLVDYKIQESEDEKNAKYALLDTFYAGFKFGTEDLHGMSKEFAKKETADVVIQRLVTKAINSLGSKLIAI